MADSPIVHVLPKLTYSMSEAADILNVSRPQLERILKAGVLRCMTMLDGGERRISYAAMLRYCDEREAAGINR